MAFGDSYFTGSEFVGWSETFGPTALKARATRSTSWDKTDRATSRHHALTDGQHVTQVNDTSITELPTPAAAILLEGGIDDALVDAPTAAVQINATCMRRLRDRYPFAALAVLGCLPTRPVGCSATALRSTQ